MLQLMELMFPTSIAIVHLHFPRRPYTTCMDVYKLGDLFGSNVVIGKAAQHIVFVAIFQKWHDQQCHRVSSFQWQVWYWEFSRACQNEIQPERGRANATTDEQSKTNVGGSCGEYGRKLSRERCRSKLRVHFDVQEMQFVKTRSGCNKLSLQPQ